MGKNEARFGCPGDIATRHAHDGGEFAMTVGNQAFSGKGAREEMAKALVARGSVPPRRLRAAAEGVSGGLSGLGG